MSGRLGAIVQARMSSRRLPGKVLRPLAGRPLLGHLLDRLARARTIDLVVVATSTAPEDDAIEALCRRERVACHRGPLDAVAVRVAQVVERFGLDAFARVCGDSPLYDWRLLDEAVTAFRRLDVDMVTNVLRRTYPSGQSVEVVSSRAFLRALARMHAPDHLEHVTRFLYEHAEGFRMHALEAEQDCSAVRLAVDTQDDFDHLAALMAAMTRAQWDYELREIMHMDRHRRRCSTSRGPSAPGSSGSASAPGTPTATTPIPAAR